jgi:esterase/lipase superfamily enzyme
MKLALRYPDMFCSAVTYGAALMEAEFLVGQFQDEYQRIFGGDLDRVRANFVWQLAPENRDALVENGVAIAMFAGTEDPTHRNNERFHELLSRLRVEHRYQEVEGVSHRLNEYFAELGSAGYARHEAALSAQTLETRAANR